MLSIRPSDSQGNEVSGVDSTGLGGEIVAAKAGRRQAPERDLNPLGDVPGL